MFTKVDRYMEAARCLAPLYGGVLPPFANDGRRVHPIRSKSGFARSRNKTVAHVVAAAGAVWINGRPHTAAGWLCGQGAIYPVFLGDPEGIDDFCHRCLDREAGPCVYRYFDDAWDLLYIGSTVARLKRRGEHSRTAPWWPEVKHIRFEECSTVAEAREAEARALLQEGPRYNQRGLTERRPA